MACREAEDFGGQEKGDVTRIVHTALLPPRRQHLMSLDKSRTSGQRSGSMDAGCPHAWSLELGSSGTAACPSSLDPGSVNHSILHIRDRGLGWSWAEEEAFFSGGSKYFILA